MPFGKKWLRLCVLLRSQDVDATKISLARGTDITEEGKGEAVMLSQLKKEIELANVQFDKKIG